jgi:uncharacterized SAM-binding protein YcdF (DUF218 family)
MTGTELAKVIWDYMRLGQTVEKSDVIIGLGCHDTLVAERAADLFLEGLAPLIVFSGGVGRLTKGTFTKSEAETFADIALQKGVPEQAILLEDKATNTGENMTFSARLLAKHSISPARIILVHKPYMERRTLATFEALWPKPQPRCRVTSLQESFAEYCMRFSQARIITIMVGDLQRIRDYPKRGFTTEQYIPPEVWGAYEQLVARGYTAQLLQ